ncbi:hypothetical protein [Prosthecobacter sp.]|uniref:hypothetical protein n=1 Tax=Prosthecobacter sp. TaxID=1965333 RepID=UPI0037844A8D
MADHDGSNREDEHANHAVAIGEIRSEEDGQFIRETLSELGIPFEGVYRASKTDELRRFFGEWYEGLQVIVRSQDAAQARVAAGSRLGPLEDSEALEDGMAYLAQRSNEQLIKLLDFSAIWPGHVLNAAASVLAARGIEYPPEGDGSKWVPLIYTMVPACFSPLACLLLPSVDRTRRTAEGGNRPAYNAKTRALLERCRTRGVIAWFVLFVLLTLVLKALIPPMQPNPPRQKPVVRHSQNQRDTRERPGWERWYLAGSGGRSATRSRAEY